MILFLLIIMSSKPPAYSSFSLTAIWGFVYLQNLFLFTFWGLVWHTLRLEDCCVILQFCLLLWFLLFYWYFLLLLILLFILIYFFHLIHKEFTFSDIITKVTLISSESYELYKLINGVIYNYSLYLNFNKVSQVFF